MSFEADPMLMEMFVMRQHPAMNAPHAFRCTVEIDIAARLRDEAG